MACRKTCSEIPLCDTAGVPDAEESQATGHHLAVRIARIWLLGPCQPFNAPVFAAIEDLLLEPGASCRVPYLDVSVCASNRQSQRSGILLSMFGFRVRECERVDRRWRVGHEAGSMDIHGESRGLDQALGCVKLRVRL